LGPIKIDDTLPASGLVGIPLTELFSGYPLPPSVGPALKGDVLVLTNPSALPVSAQGSTLAAVPVLLTGVSIAPIPGSTSLSVTLTYKNLSTGSNFTLNATAFKPTTLPHGAGPTTSVSSPSSLTVQ
jgi:hypothetical protein